MFAGWSKGDAEEEIRNRWATRWRQADRSSWTRTVLPDAEMWLKRASGGPDFWMTQLLTGHGCFNDYLLRMNRRDQDTCVYCNEVDGVEHTFLRCTRWTVERCAWRARRPGPDNMRAAVEEGLQSREGWEALSRFAKAVLEQKLEEERAQGF